MKRLIITMVLVAGLLATRAFVETARIPAQGSGDEHTKIRIGLAIAPVPLNLRGRNPALVGLGSYLVDASGHCNGCHASDASGGYLPGGNPFQGQPALVDPNKFLVGGRAFGPFTSRNLRPDPVTGQPAGLTFPQFVEAMRYGTDFKNLHPGIPRLQVMPWPNAGQMTDRDLRAIYEYLSALPPVP